MRVKIMVLVVVVLLGVMGFLYKDVLLGMASDLGILSSNQTQNDEIDLPLPQPTQASQVPQNTCDGNNISECIKQANELVVANKPIDGIKLLFTHCENKNAQSCEAIADIYGTSLKDSTMSLAYNKRACDLGGLSGCYALGVKYYRGDGVNKDVKRSFVLFKQACDGGKIEGCNNLAVIYNNAEGVKRDVKLAKSLFKKACDSGYKPSCENLAKIK